MIGWTWVAAVLASAPAAEPALPSWMAGCWIEQRDAVWTEECWTSARGGMMIGSSRTGTGDTVASWETMQIIAGPGGMTFYAAPGGQGRTAFARETTPDAGGVTFVNTTNDYPQRIRYWREGEMLKAEIALADGSNVRRWAFRRVG